jgi:hypothetical protein
MRPWLVAVFALHFFLSVGAFAFGQVPGAETSQAHVQHLVADAVSPEKTAPDGSLKAGHSSDRGLTDIPSDLPECLDVLIATSGPRDPLRTPSPPLAQDLTPPALDGPQRPPRGLPARA